MSSCVKKANHISNYISYRQLNKNDHVAVSLAFYCISFIKQILNSFSLERKFSSETGQHYVSMLWKKCLPKSLNLLVVRKILWFWICLMFLCTKQLRGKKLSNSTSILDKTSWFTNTYTIYCSRNMLLWIRNKKLKNKQEIRAKTSRGKNRKKFVQSAPRQRKMK